MTARVQQARISANNSPPANGSLSPGQLFVEMGTPLRLWGGVPSGIDATGRKLILDADANTTALGTKVAKAGDTMTGSLVLAGVSTAPNAVPGTNTLQIANTAYVVTALAPYALTSSVPVGSASAPVMDGTAAAGAATAWARGDHVHPTDTTRYAASNPSGYQTAAQVAAVSQGFNYTDNAGFSVNQRGYVSGTALAAGAYGHDRWKAGAGGCTYTFTASPPSTTITITAGTLQQVVEGASISGGNYMLSWTGTAQGRLGAGAYAASPLALTGIAAGANTTMEFNTGTLGRVKLEPGTVVTSWIAAPVQQDLAKCQRFYQIGYFNYSGSGTGGVSTSVSQQLPVAFRAAPTFVNTGGGASTNFSNAVIASAGSPMNSSFYIAGNPTATGAFAFFGNYSASADL